ncbi:MAG: cation-translocating P-type ATPase [Fulvimarina manganoxydans]|uniref:heavy metal translocating P-type ATPase n=1 Tax=Fulvimarina manganoxydans TaxID=937218 RepID=UPI002356C9E4|nr:cation-translocating P-type ATPase [Fulvimarina manganoxydans]MCK5932215.1 cation-translocating P-type ATPase [Fulvimarina manganoxydans]
MTTLELPIGGMDCAACARKAQRALLKVQGVQKAEVLLNAEKAVVETDLTVASMDALRAAIEKVGFTVPAARSAEIEAPLAAQSSALQRQLFTILGVLFGVILFIVVAGEGLGLIDEVTERVPWWIGTAIVVAFGYTIFADVIRSALRREVTSHTLMSVGAVAALVIGQWATAAVVVFFMRVGEYAERFTSERARQSLKALTALAPQTARVVRGGVEAELPLGEVVPGDVVIVRPGERVPVDGTVLEGQATLDQAAITGESMPVEAEAGDSIYAATLARLGHLKLRAERVGRDTTFGRTIRLVEEAEANRGEIQRVADKFSAYYLPVVATIALLTYLLSGNVLATVAVLVVACSCSFALATPIAMMASIGAAAKRGLLIKGGKYVEALNTADVVLVDKTGTLTTGKPQITDVVPTADMTEQDLLALAAAAERHSEHPLADAVRRGAAERGLVSSEPERFEAFPGKGIRASVNGRHVEIGNRRLVAADGAAVLAEKLEGEGKTLLFVAVDGQLAGILAAMDTVRPEVAKALGEVRKLGIGRIELLTGDHERTAAAIAEPLDIGFRANLLPEDKIRIVRELQAEGRRVIMIGDGVNDAPALAQADIGIAMGGGTDVAMEAAHIVLMREDWGLVADLFRIARRTMGVVKTNIAFTAIYNIVGLSFAAVGLLPPIYAAALQSIPDIGILANSSRLIRQR